LAASTVAKKAFEEKLTQIADLEKRMNDLKSEENVSDAGLTSSLSLSLLTVILWLI